ncbi:PQ loop repeat-domain-containing protein [Dichotomocladium elegans]|nr:PQ loop repeat-domain-containing protein [Dichotomocladium elegans]
MIQPYSEDSSCSPTMDGIPYIRWIHLVFGDCVYTWRECLSVLLGYFSILCWLHAQLPQIIKNYRLQNAESLSFTFLAIWLIGDIGNFIGCVLTEQMDFQLYLAIYFTITDATLCWQWLYYVKYPHNWFRCMLNPSRPERRRLVGGEETEEEEEERPIITIRDYHSVSPPSTVRTLLAVVGLVSLGMSPGYQALSLTTSHEAGAWVTGSSGKDRVWIGRFFAWLCAFLYLASRVPQIIRNFCRRSVEGLSMALFLCAAVGNLTYTLGIFVNPHQTRQSLLEAVPYIVGSAGTLFFDLSVYGQYLYYNCATEEKKPHRASVDIP